MVKLLYYGFSNPSSIRNTVCLAASGWLIEPRVLARICQIDELAIENVQLQTGLDYFERESDSPWKA